MENSRQQGFTLIELVLVIVLIGILAVVAAPRFHSAAVYSDYQYIEELRTALRHGQKLALASGCRVQVSQSASGFSLLRDSDCLSSTSDFSSAVSDPLNGGSYSRALPSGVTPSPATFSLTFDSLGRASSALSLQVGSRSLSVTAATGLIE